MHKYRGFISYSHADKAAANRLLKRLQTYRLPKGIKGPNDRHLGDFFMDRESLPAADNLSDAISTGLANAQALIVLCSPAAAKSEWVRKEIEAFRKLNPDKEVLAVVLSGAPETRTGDEVCFPSPLLADNAEPLAADLRKNGDGKKLGFLKLVSALSDTPLETLLHRNQTRQRNRVIAITALSVLITLSMSTLAAVAISARQDAETRRADAEGLVDFMLTNLRDRLEPLGRMDVLEGVATTALGHYQDETVDNLECGQIKQKARALHLLTEIKYSTNDEAKEAQQLAEEALSLTEYGLKTCSDDAEMYRDHGISLFYRSVDELDREDYDSFIESHKGYDDNIEVYCERLPEAKDCAVERAFVQNGYGVATLRFDDFKDIDASIMHFQNAIDLYETSEPFRKGSFRVLDFHANGYGWLARAYLARGDAEKAVSLRAIGRDLYQNILSERLAGIESSEGRLRRRIVAADIGQMRALLAADSPNTVLNMLPDILLRAERLINHDPDNRVYRRQKWRILVLRAIAQKKLGQDGDACLSWLEADEYRPVVPLDPISVPEATEDLSFRIEKFCETGE